MDGVRGVFFCSVDPVLVSISEDCLVKLWDIRQFASASENSHLEPYLTLREHVGPIFTVTGTQIEA